MIRRVVLVGAGHAHLEVTRAARRFAERGAELVLIDPGRFWYSGLGSALLSGRLRDEEDTVDPAALAQASGARHMADRVVGIDRRSRLLQLKSGGTLGYDFVSFNVGSVADTDLPIDGKRVWSVKPISALPRLRRKIMEADGPLSVVVAGGGPTGCEVAGNLLQLAKSHKAALSVTLVAAGSQLLEQAPPGAAKGAADELQRRGAVLRIGETVEAVRGDAAILGSGAAIRFDHLLVATGLRADPLITALDLPADPIEGLKVGRTLQSVGDPRIFAVGDCASIEDFHLPKIGVYGVRAAPILRDNLLAALEGKPLNAYRPQKRYLSVLEMGDGTGLAMRDGLWWHGRSALRLKHWIDRRFLARYRRGAGGGS